MNNLLQGKLANAASEAGRVAVNTTAGVLGVFNVATEFGMEKHNEDFGRFGYGAIFFGVMLDNVEIKDRRYKCINFHRIAAQDVMKGLKAGSITPPLLICKAGNPLTIERSFCRTSISRP